MGGLGGGARSVATKQERIGPSPTRISSGTGSRSSSSCSLSAAKMERRRWAVSHPSIRREDVEVDRIDSTDVAAAARKGRQGAFGAAAFGKQRKKPSHVVGLLLAFSLSAIFVFCLQALLTLNSGGRERSATQQLNLIESTVNPPPDPRDTSAQMRSKESKADAPPRGYHPSASVRGASVQEAEPKKLTATRDSPHANRRRTTLPPLTNDIGTDTDGKRLLYIAYDARYGQLNNQISSFINAVTISKMLTAGSSSLRTVLIVPKISTGIDSRFSASIKKPSNYTLFGDYFNFTAMNATQHLISTDNFLRTPAAETVANAHLKIVPTNHKVIESGHEIYEALNVTQLVEAEEIRYLKAIKDTRKYPRLCDVFPMLTDIAREWIGNNPGSPLVPFGKAYLANHQLDCGEIYGEIRDTFRTLRPNDEYIRSAEITLGTMVRPIVGIHLRLLFKEEYFDRNAVVSLLKAGLENSHLSLEEVRTLYLAYGNREMNEIVSAECIQAVKEEVPHVDVRICQDGFDCPDQSTKELVIKRRSGVAVTMTEEQYNIAFRASFSAAILDLWMCVESDFFIGRVDSTYSRNVVFIRRYAKETASHLYDGKRAFHKETPRSKDTEDAAKKASTPATNTSPGDKKASAPAPPSSTGDSRNPPRTPARSSDGGTDFSTKQNVGANTSSTKQSAGADASSTKRSAGATSPTKRGAGSTTSSTKRRHPPMTTKSK